MTAPILRPVFFARVRASGLLGTSLSQTEVDGLGGILDAWEQQGWPADIRFVAYTMATAWHECRLDLGISEVGRGRGKAYGGAQPNGQTYYGRGASQLTWLANYQKFSRLLGVDLVKDPDLALVPTTSAAILIIGCRDGLFRAGRTLARYFNDRKDDPVGARDIVNGDTVKNGARIAAYHRVFLACLEAALLPAGSPVPVGPVTTTPLPPPAITAKPGFGARLVGLLMKPWLG
ncbi:glycoside hydrolase family 19 protein [Methylobacterium sp. 1030]|uniref:glycoside hydrolase family 19 protein n=1 Tax=Methylobacterium sp. 1030 TaxID=3156404 RepID=UPI003390A2FB